MTQHQGDGSSGHPVSRRSLLGGAAALASASAVASAETFSEPLTVPVWTKEPGRAVGLGYGLPASGEKAVARELTTLAKTALSSWSYTPLQHLHSALTPNGLFFERHHAGVPEIEPAEHQLVVHGAVRQPLKFSMSQLLRFPSVARFHFLECSGNTLTEWRKPTGTSVQQTHGLLSCCQWVGVPLSAVLEEAGVKGYAQWILAEGADAAAMSRSIPLSKAMHDCLLVYAQNGERLRPEQGYPLRLLVPGFEGNMSVKWLRRLEVSDQPFHTREETSKYTDLMPDGRARQFTFVMEAKSVITFPSPGHKLTDPGYYEVRGLAWSGRGNIAHVEVSLDSGRTWQRARLDEPVLAKCLTGFRLGWRWNGKPTTILSRATDETGYQQPTREELVLVRGEASIYHYNAIQAWSIDETGKLANVHV